MGNDDDRSQVGGGFYFERVPPSRTRGQSHARPREIQFLSGTKFGAEEYTYVQ